jgi:hypothetical protein
MAETTISGHVRIQHADDVEVTVTGAAAALMRGRGAPPPGRPPQPPVEFAGALADAGLTVDTQFEIRPKGPARPGQRTLRGLPDQSTTGIDVDLAPGEGALVLLESNGVYAWKLPSEPGRPGSGPSVRGVAPRTVGFDLSIPQPPPGAPARGVPGAERQPRRSIIGDWIADAVFEPIRGYVLKFAVMATIDAALAYLEGDKAAGLCAIAGMDPKAWRPGGAQLPAIAADRPARILLMVHGTFSSTEGSFGALAATAQGRAFLAGAAARYDAILGFDHKTLVDDPAANAAAMQQALLALHIPDNSVFDAVAYSRGGLVYRQWAEADLPKSAPSWKLGKAIFVACTNGGTHLAEPDNWTAMVELYTNIAVASTKVLGLLGVAGETGSVLANQIVKTVARFLQVLAEQAIAEDRVPGLAAMRPSSALITALNGASDDAERLAKYFAVTSNFIARFDGHNGFTRELASFVIDRVTNRLFQTKNDLVVDSDSMIRFGQRATRHAEGDTFGFGDTEDVYHTVYFAQEQLAAQLSGWLGLRPELKSGPPPAPDQRDEEPAERPRLRHAPGLSAGEPAVPPPAVVLERLDRVARRIADEAPPVLPEATQDGATALTRKPENRVTCQFAAQMEANPALNKPTPLNVIISREAIDLQIGETAKKTGDVAVDVARPLVVEVIAQSNCRVQDGTTTQETVDVPQPNNPVRLRFMLQGLGAGAAEVLVEARQGARVLASFLLKPVYVDPAARQISATATATASVGSDDVERHAVIRIYELSLGDQVLLKFNLECENPNINISGETRLPTKFSRELFVAQKYKEIEQAWISDPQDFQKFSRRLRASGITMADALLPDRIRRELWEKRKQIKAIQVISDEPYIPWELLFLADPDPARNDRDGEGFLAELGLVRWLHNTSWPPARFTLGTRRCYHVIPEYPDPRYQLPGAADERQMLKALFDGSLAALKPDSGEVTDFLATEPRDCELIHFACHGDTQQQGGFDSDLLMQGRMIGTQYQPDKFSSDMVFANLRFSKPGTSPVVFLNSCRTGQVGLTITGAGGFAQSFLNPRSQQGAGIFVGAQWSISDSTALTFAKTFYGALLAGKTLIDAATEARAESRKAEEFTWLAYTIYGDPLARVAR